MNYHELQRFSIIQDVLNNKLKCREATSIAYKDHYTTPKAPPHSRIQVQIIRTGLARLEELGIVRIYLSPHC